MEINELIKRAYGTAKNKGFHDNTTLDSIGLIKFNAMGQLARLMLVVTEVAEAAEEVRKGNKEKFEEEIADIFIRLFDLCGAGGINLEKRLLEKMDKNEQRPRMHGKLV